MFCFCSFGVQLKSQLTEQNKPFKFELSKLCDQEVFAIATLEEAKLGHKMVHKQFIWKQPNNNFSIPILCIYFVGFLACHSCNEFHIFLPRLVIILQRNLTGADFDHVLGDHVWTVGRASHNQQNNALNCKFCQALLYGNCLYCLDWMELIIISLNLNS